MFHKTLESTWQLCSVISQTALGEILNILRSCMNMVAQPCLHDISFMVHYWYIKVFFLCCTTTEIKNPTIQHKISLVWNCGLQYSLHAELHPFGTGIFNLILWFPNGKSRWTRIYLLNKRNPRDLSKMVVPLPSHFISFLTFHVGWSQHRISNIISTLFLLMTGDCLLYHYFHHSSELKSFAAGHQSMESKTDRFCQWLLDRLLQPGNSINKYRVIFHELWNHYFLPSWRLAEKWWILCWNQNQWSLREGSFN